MKKYFILRWTSINTIITVTSLYVFFSASLLASEINENISVSSSQFNSILLTTGFDYSSGFYGLKNSTDMLYVPFVFKYRQQAWDFAITFSYIKMTGPGGVIGGGDGGVIPVNGNRSNSLLASDSTNIRAGHGNGNGNKPTTKNITTHEGVGDTLFKVGYALDTVLDIPFLFELASQIKIPLADEKKELGTGKMDWSVSVDLADNWGLSSPFINLGYKFMGQPEELDFNNVYFASFGLDYIFLPYLHGGIIYDYQEKIISDGFNISESTFYLNWTLNKTFSINSYIVSGFSPASPDWASGLQISILF
ncbi:MAG: hypothetical protein QM504_18810 [Pseudomonadota bacterium]